MAPRPAAGSQIDNGNVSARSSASIAIEGVS
jgi:hypothetical protein